MINKKDLAPYVGADLDVMQRDADRMRHSRPFVFSDMKRGEGVERIVESCGLKAGCRCSRYPTKASTPSGLPAISPTRGERPRRRRSLPP